MSQDPTRSCGLGQADAPRFGVLTGSGFLGSGSWEVGVDRLHTCEMQPPSGTNKTLELTFAWGIVFACLASLSVKEGIDRDGKLRSCIQIY